MLSMEGDRPDWKTVLRYGLLQVPGTILILLAALLMQKHTSWPGWIVWSGFGAWVAKDVLLFFWVWPSYRESGGRDPLVGQTGRVVRPCRPEGTVEICGTLWKAVAEEDEHALPRGTKIRVSGRERLTLRVKPSRHRE